MHFLTSPPIDLPLLHSLGNSEMSPQEAKVIPTDHCEVLQASLSENSLAIQPWDHFPI